MSSSSHMPKKILNICLVIGLVTAFFFASQYGWTPLTRYNAGVTPQEAESAHRLEQTVTVLAKDIGLRNYHNDQGLDLSAAFILEAFQSLECAVKSQSYTASGQSFQNIIAQYSNADPAKPTLVIGAHYDAHFNPGADDNASGVAGLLELARLMRNTSLKYNLKFVAFTNEEPPFFRSDAMGSQMYIKSLGSSAEKIHGAIILEMLGYYSEEYFSQTYPPLLGLFYPNRGNFIAVVGNFLSKELVKSVYTEFRATERFPVERIVAPDSLEGIGFSDHWSFWQAGIPAVMITDTAYLRNPNYHQLSDVVGTLNFIKMAKVVHGLKDTIIELK